jgi:DtxR family Mn-dependent transcriptional regulator
VASQSVEEYLEAIYRLGGEGGMVNTCDLANLLGVAPPSVTTMLRRLSRDGLVEHILYRGISLTPRGCELAASMIRRHRLSERLLTDVLGIPWERVHDAACRLEHVITGEIEEKAYEVLGQPERCPHGHLIEGSENQYLALFSQTRPGDRAVVVKVAEDQSEFLRSAAELGLVPSAEIVVESVSDGRVALDIAGVRRTVEMDFAERIWVRLVLPPG